LKGRPACFLHDLLQSSITNDVTTEKKGSTLKGTYGRLEILVGKMFRVAVLGACAVT
jgi:hypothetical protein